jgi:hypothetical protein
MRSPIGRSSYGVPPCSGSSTHLHGGSGARPPLPPPCRWVSVGRVFCVLPYKHLLAIPEPLNDAPSLFNFSVVSGPLRGLSRWLLSPEGLRIGYRAPDVAASITWMSLAAPVSLCHEDGWHAPEGTSTIRYSVLRQDTPPRFPSIVYLRSVRRSRVQVERRPCGRPLCVISLPCFVCW